MSFFDNSKLLGGNLQQAAQTRVRTDVTNLEGVSKTRFGVVDEATSPFFADNAAGLVASSTTKILHGWF